MSIRAGKTTFVIDRAKLDEIVMAARNAGVGQAATRLQRIIKASFTKTPRGVHAPVGRPPGIQSDQLRQSISVGKPDRGRCEVFTNTHYAPFHEFGGTMVSSGKLFTVPLSQEAARLRKNTSDLKSLNLTLIKSRGGKLLLVREMKTRTKPLFVLTRTIRMPKRPFMRPAIENRENVAAITKAFAAGFKRELRRGFKVLVTGSDAA